MGLMLVLLGPLRTPAPKRSISWYCSNDTVAASLVLFTAWLKGVFFLYDSVNEDWSKCSWSRDRPAHEERQTNTVRKKPKTTTTTQWSF